MLDVGQGDCIYIRTPDGSHYLCDGGSTSKLQTGTWQVIPFLKHQGVSRLELIFISHCDTDHISAVKEILDWAGEGKVRIGGLVLAASGTEDEMRASLIETAQKNGVPVYRMEAGDQIRRGSALFQAVYPFSEKNTSGKASADRNASSLVLRFSRLRGSEACPGEADAPEQGRPEEAFFPAPYRRSGGRRGKADPGALSRARIRLHHPENRSSRLGYLHLTGVS